ncbi:putative Protein disulfide-isomerase [Blattamonas nauphoetae]|uniref:Thioredoxin domain-containing protein n=1 Tax=Blattamonas nauphoetae TaxID=2049346 RepID=A0ABQ9YL74_9EUKA|nr:putative Protein disulfide-isomerase [Blattamonas nauphoetae]
MIVISLLSILSFVFGQIVTLDESTYADPLQNTPSIVLYSQSSDPNTEELSSLFSQVAPLISPLGLSVAQLDCSSFSEQCKELNIGSESKIRFHHLKGKSNDFDGPKTVDSLVQWTKDALLQTVRVFPSREAVNAIFADFPHIILGTFSSRNSEYNSLLSCSATRAKTDTYAAIIDPSTESQTLEFLYTAGNASVPFTGGWSFFSIAFWVQDQSNTPLIDEISAYNAYRYLPCEKPVGYFFVDKKRNDMHQVYSLGLELAQKHKGKMLFVIVDHNVHWRMTQTLGLDARYFPSFTIEAKYPSPVPDTKAHYPLLPTPENARWGVYPEMTMETVGEFCQKWLDGEIPLTLRSEPIPNEQANKTIRVVGDTFNQIVIDSENYVFMKFTAPWCHKCGKLKPEFEQLANELSDEKKITFADMDITLNDPPPHFIVDGYPTLLLFKPGQKDQPVKCEDFFSFQKIRRFLNTNIPGLNLSVDEEAIKQEDIELQKERLEREKAEKEQSSHHDEL